MTRSPDEITKALLEPFPKSAIKTRTDRGKALGYIEAHTVIRRLIEATGNAFDVAVIDQQVQPWTQTRNGTPQLMVTARVRLTIPGMGSREHMGVQIVQEGGGEDMWKGAISDALKKAATLFGVGLDLYGPDYEAGEVDDRAVSQRPAPRQDAPQRAANAPRSDRTPVQAAQDVPVDRGRESAIQSLHAALAKHGLTHANAHDYFTMPERGYGSIAEVPTGEIVALMQTMAKLDTSRVRAMFPPDGGAQPPLVDAAPAVNADRWTN